MVTTTPHEPDDELPARDALGTDLRRVATLLERGWEEQGIAEILGITVDRARHAIIVVTGDRQGSPSPEEIAAAVREIQAGWTEEQAIAARRGEQRSSSTAVRDPRRWAEGLVKRAAAHAASKAFRVAHGPIRVIHHADWVTERRFEARVHYGSRSARRCFVTHAEAEAWGREWLTAEHESDAEASQVQRVQQEA